jgi:site-specific recombinase XerD
MTPNTFSVQFIIKADKQDNGGFVPIYAKIFINGCKIELSTFQKISPSHWDKTKRQVKPHIKTAIEVNQFLEKFKSRIYSCYSKLMGTDEDLNATTFKSKFYGKAIVEKVPKIIEVAEQHNKNFESLIGVKYSHGSFKNYRTTLKYLKEFIPKAYKLSDLELKKVNFTFCEKFYSFLTTEKSCNTNGANKQIQRLKKIINYSIKQGFIHFNPMATFSLEFKPVNKIALTTDEINRVAEITFQRETLANVRNVFLFQCYTGLSYADVKRVSKKHLQADDKGKLWIRMERAKTTTYFSVPLLPKALEILELYSELNHKEGYLLPVLSNQKMNDNLKVIQEIAKINKSLTTHLARHTFATTITLGNGVPIETVSRMLGHTKLSTTQVYAKVLENKIERDMKQLSKKLK